MADPKRLSPKTSPQLQSKPPFDAKPPRKTASSEIEQDPGVIERLSQSVTAMSQQQQLLAKAIESMNANLVQFQKNLSTDMANLKMDMDNMKREVKQDTEKFKREMMAEFAELKKVTVNLSEKTVACEKRVQQCEEGLRRHETEMESHLDKLALIELQGRETALRLRQVPEVPNEQLLDRMVKEIAEFLGEEESFIRDNTDRCFRLNSAYARRKNVPRDIWIQFSRRRIRDRLLYEHLQRGWCIDGGRVILLKDVPPRILRKRRDYRFLTDRLKSWGIPFSWERLEGVSFTYRGTRHRLTTIHMAREFLRKYAADFDDRQGPAGFSTPSTSTAPFTPESQPTTAVAVEASTEDTSPVLFPVLETMAPAVIETVIDNGHNSE